MPITESRATEIMEEVAEAEAAGVAPEDLVTLRQSIASEDVSGAGFTYPVAAADAASWIPAWRLEVSRDGTVFGKPTKLPKGNLATYLSKKRFQDGGPLFTLRMPANILGPGHFQCFAAPEACQKRTDTKGKLLDHMEAYHPAESRWYQEHIDEIRKSIVADNPALTAMVKQIAGTADQGPLAVPVKVQEQHNEHVVEPAVQSATVETFSVAPDATCPFCPWEPKAGTTNVKIARDLHVKVKHAAELE